MKILPLSSISGTQAVSVAGHSEGAGFLSDLFLKARDVMRDAGDIGLWLALSRLGSVKECGATSVSRTTRAAAAYAFFTSAAYFVVCMRMYLHVLATGVPGGELPRCVAAPLAALLLLLLREGPSADGRC